MMTVISIGLEVLWAALHFWQNKVKCQGHDILIHCSPSSSTYM